MAKRSSVEDDHDDCAWGAAWRLLAACLWLGLAAPAQASQAPHSLPPPHSGTDRVKQALTHLSGALSSAKCIVCHGAEGEARSSAIWRLALLAKAALLKPKTEAVGPKDFGLYYTLSGQGRVQMPPIDPHHILKTNQQLLDQLSVNKASPILAAELKAAGADLGAYQASLGTQLIYVNPRGVCFDREATGATLVVGDLCAAFNELAQVASTWKGTVETSVKSWQLLTSIAKTSDLFQIKVPSTAPLLELKPSPASDPKPPTVAMAAKPPPPRETVIYRLADDETISFFTRIAPDESWIGLRTEGIKGHRTDTRPFLWSPHGEKSRYLDGSTYDAIFVPDFNARAGHGFILAQRSAGTNGTFAKVLNFYLPDGKESPKRHWTFEDISGYPTIAKITEPNSVNKAWARFDGQYIVMGKRWRWFSAGLRTDDSGRTTGISQVYPGGERTAAPICPNLWRDGKGLDLMNADAMVSPDGRFISTNRGSDHALLVVGSKSCSVEHIVRRHGVTLPGGKATFSADSRLLAFHAYGSDGKTFIGGTITDNGMIARLANSGMVSNIFVYDMETEHVVQLTNYDQTKPYVALYPMLSGDGDTLYFHRHGRGSRASEIVKIEDFQQVFEDADAEQNPD